MTTQFDSAQKAKLTQIINEGMGVMSEVEALNEGLGDTVKAIAEVCLKKQYVLHTKQVTLQKKKIKNFLKKY